MAELSLLVGHPVGVQGELLSVKSHTFGIQSFVRKFRGDSTKGMGTKERKCWPHAAL